MTLRHPLHRWQTDRTLAYDPVLSARCLARVIHTVPFSLSRAACGLTTWAFLPPTLTTLSLVLAPMYGHAAPTAARLTVSLLQDEGATVRLRVRLPAGLEPALAWSGTAGPAPYRLVLVWQGVDVTLNRTLPELPPGGIGPLQAVALRTETDATRLELQISHPVEPSLLRVGDSWVLRLDPVAPAMAPPSMPAPAAVAGSATVPSARPPERRRESAITGSHPKSETLLLDVTVNNQRLAGVVRAEQLPGGMLLLPAEVWAEARLAVPAQAQTLSDGTPAFALEGVPGATYQINRQNLSLEVTAPAAAFVGSTLKSRNALAEPPPRPQAGALLNYDVSVGTSGAGGPVTSGATLEAVAFNAYGSFVSSALVRDEGAKRTAERLDTFWRYDMPQRLETLVVGDTVGSGGGWSRPARYGGIRWGRDFGMRPGFVTLPQVTLTGEAALPSTVEVLVNNARRMSQPLPPGPFELTNVPVITGAGEINLVVRDLLGRETVVRQSYYASPRLLAPGLTDFSFEGGWLRSGYGRGSKYDDMFGAATWRQGLSSSLTGEARIELQAKRRAAGLELAGLLGQWGVGRVALAASSASTQGFAEQGQLLQLGIERNTPRGGGAVQYERYSQGFAPFGEGIGATAAAQRARERWLATIGGPLWDGVTGGISFVSQSRWDGDQVQTLGLSLNQTLWQRANLSLSLNKRLDGDKAWRAALSLIVPLYDGIHTAARVDLASSVQPVASVSASRNAPAGPGLGWRVEASSLESQRARAGMQYNTSQIETTVDLASDARGQVATRGGARGTLGLLAGQPFASRPVGQGSFAMVEVEGMSGVPVKRSNQVVAKTDARGLAFVPGLLPWEKNRIEIDPVDLPLDSELSEAVQEVTPYAGSGAVVKFSVKRSRQALVELHQANGQPVPAGTQVRLLPGGPSFVAGRRGEVWLSELAAERQQLEITWPGGSNCRLTLVAPAMDGAMYGKKIGPLACPKE